MTTVTLPRPLLRTDADGLPIRRVEVTDAHRPGDGLDEAESWARLGVVAAVAFTVGIGTYHLAPWVGWRQGFLDAVYVVAVLAVIVPAAHVMAGWVRLAVRFISAEAWRMGLIEPRRTPWLPPLPWLPSEPSELWWPSEPMVVIPWHGHYDRDSVIVRHVRVARPVKWALIYRDGLVVAVAQIWGQRWVTPERLSLTVGRRLGITARTYRAYAAGHSRLSILEVGAVWTIPQPVTLTDLGVVGPVGSHRYLEKEKK